MEISEINMITNFEVGIECLQNPSLISSFWKWGALIFAVFATLSSIIKRIKFIFIHFHAFNNPPSNQNEETDQFSDEDDISIASSDDEQEEEEDNAPTTSFLGQQRFNEDFCVKGSKNQWQTGHLSQRISGGAWSEFTSGENVVKLWNKLGLSLDFDKDLINYDSQNVVSLWGLDHDQNISKFSGRAWNIPATAMTWKCDGVVLSCYDTRMPSHTPALHAEWRSAAAGVTGGGDGKVYVRDDVSGVVTVGDVRNVTVPLESVREFDGDIYWGR